MKLEKQHSAYLILLIAGGISVLAFAPSNRALFIIISLLPLLWYSHDWLALPTAKTSCRGALIYACGYFFVQLYWIFYSLYAVIDTGLIVAILALCAFAGVMTLFILAAMWLFWLLATKSDEFNILFLLPSLWVSAEWLRGWIFTGFPWSDVAYTQVNNYLLQGFFPLLGSYGVSWVTMSIVGFLYLVIRNNQVMVSQNAKISRHQRWAIIYFTLLGLSAYALHGKEYTQNYGRPTSVALVQENIDEAAKWDMNKLVDNLDHYAKTIARTKADIILLPETAFPIYEKYLPLSYLADVIHFAKLNNAEVVIGMPKLINDKGDYVNSATLITSPNQAYYAKTHLVPFGEYIPLKDLWGKFYLLAKLPMVGFSAGPKNQAPLVVANQKIAFNICYENGFGSELITAAAQATLMVNLSDMVWYGKSMAKDQHLHLSQARALENQRYFIQETNTGETAIINPYGQVQSRLADFSVGVLHDYVQGRVGETPYQRLGNYPIICWCALILLVALFLRRQRL